MRGDCGRCQPRALGLGKWSPGSLVGGGGGGARGPGAGRPPTNPQGRRRQPLAQVFSSNLQEACQPFQFAHSTRAGTVGAFDISRLAMLSGLSRVPGASACLPFARQFYAHPLGLCGMMLQVGRTRSTRQKARRPAHAGTLRIGPAPGPGRTPAPPSPRAYPVASHTRQAGLAPPRRPPAARPS